MKDLIVLGASGFAKEVAWLVERINSCSKQWNLLGFIDEDKSTAGRVIGGYRVLGTSEVAKEYPKAQYICAIGSSQIRQKAISKILTYLPEAQFATLIDPSVMISKRVKVGGGSIICAGTIITVDIDIGDHVIVNLDCTIGHDAIIKDYVTIYPSVNISGNTLIENGVELGTGTQIIQGKKIGEGTIVGAGAVVVKDLPAHCTAVGAPAKPIKFFEK